MEMCYDGALVMPSSCALMSEDEMTYVDGGAAILAMKKSYLNKGTCKSMAKELIKVRSVKGMSTLAIAQEIFAHAVMYYVSSGAIAAGIDKKVVREIQSRAYRIRIDDGGDKWYRRGVYAAIWNYCPSYV